MTRELQVPNEAATDSGHSGRWSERLGSTRFICLWLVLGTAIAYWSVSRNDFVNYDDPDYVTANAHVQVGLSWANVVWAFTTGHASNWHPLTWLSHMLDCQVFGQDPAAHHLVNLGFHVANALLLFLVMRKLTGAHWRSAAVAALFALHPLHVESVAWISERKDVLSAFFLLLTLAAYAWYVDQSTARSPRPAVHGPQSAVHSQSQVPSPGSASANKSRATYHVSRPTFYVLRLTPDVSRFTPYALALTCFALGLMSKPMLVTLPFLLLLLDYWPLGRFQLGLDFSQLWRLIAEKLPFLALSLASSVVTFLVQKTGGAVSTSVPLGARISNGFVSYARYLGKTFWPQDLAVLYPHPGHWAVWEVIGAAGLLGAVTGAAGLLAHRKPYVLVGWLWFVGTLVPVIGLVQVGIQSMADRYSYVPSIGIFVILVWGVPELLPERPWRQPALRAGVALVLLTCGLLTAGQVQIWHSSETLFRHTAQVTSKNYLAYNNLGFYLAGHGRLEEAMEDYRKALEINPLYEDALNNLGYALATLKRPAEAIPFYEAALRVKPSHVEVHNNLGNALSEIGRISEAIQHYEFVLQKQPDHADAHNNLGIALAMQGRLDEALPHFRAAIRYKPNYASAHSNLGNGLAAQHKFQEAIVEYRESLRLNPKDAQAHNNLGNVLAEQNQLKEAIEQYSEAIGLNADNPEAHFNLGIVLARQGKTAEAIAHYREALRLKPDYAEARKQLSALVR